MWNHLRAVIVVKSPLELGCQVSSLVMQSRSTNYSYAVTPPTVHVCLLSRLYPHSLHNPRILLHGKSSIHHCLQNLRLTSYRTLNPSNNCSCLIGKGKGAHCKNSSPALECHKIMPPKPPFTYAQLICQASKATDGKTTL